MKNKWLILSLATVILFSFLITLIWTTEHNSYKPNENELIDDSAVIHCLNESKIDIESNSTSTIGIYVNSLQFTSSNDIELTGYVWQTINNDNITNETFGIVFPESVGGTSFEERYSKETENGKTVGWYFETVLRQQFDYSKYPLDHKTVWVRVIPADFSSSLVLLPDLQSYASTGFEDSFGISKDIVLNGWKLTETFFDYHHIQYDTTFGLGDNHMRKDHPELSFNIVIERNFIQGIIVNLTLIIVIMALLYSLVLMITSEEDKLLGSFGMSASGAIGTTSALFFSILIAHIELRSMFGGQLVYLEMFYYVAYIFILCISILIFVFMKELKNSEHAIIKNNANIFKLLYWPVYLGVILVVTYFWMR